MRIKLGVLGPEGTFGEVAAKEYNKEAEFIFFNTHHEIIEALMKNKIDEGIVAVENMINGTVREVLDELYENDIMVKQEIIIPVHLCIAGISNTANIIISHPAAILQVRKYIRENHNNSELKYVDSTAKAMELAAEINGSAAIGLEAAADKFNLNVLDRDIEDHKGNKTKFFIISKKDADFCENKKHKTFIGIYHEGDYPGLLYELLKPFAKSGINLTKIESRPTKFKLGNYIFFIEFEGHRQEKKIKEVLDEIEIKVTKLKIIGSFITDEGKK
ncbi:prephenate dehydratase [Candidatus Woesearchaeota archaeon]|nr:prephenate dehydratase [Candidatus Woesearchaeota archaeon]